MSAVETTSEATSAVGASVIGVLILMLVAMLVCMAVAAVYVYKDAKKRNMNEVVWTLVAFIVPFFIGVIVYFAIREPLKENICPVCGEELIGNPNECEKCSTVLMTSCNKCGFPIKKDWRACPSCGNELPENFSQPVTRYKKESGIIPIAIIIGVLVLAFAMISSIGSCAFIGNVESSSSRGYTGYNGMYNIKAEDFAGNEAITKWIADSDKDKADVAVLLSKNSGVCIVYVKDSKYLLKDDVELEYIDEGTKNAKCISTICIRESQYDDKYGYDFFVYELEVFDDMQLEIYVDEDKQDVEVTYIDADISIDTWEVE